MMMERRQMCSFLKIKQNRLNDREEKNGNSLYRRKKIFKGTGRRIAWDGEKLVGLLRAIDDGELLAYLHYLLVSPEYQGHGIARNLLELMKDKYKDYLYIELMPEEKKNVSFYEKYGFKVVDGATPMQKSNFEGFKD